MLIAGLTNNPYLENQKHATAVALPNPESLSSGSQDSVTLSPEAKAAFEKLAAYPAWAGQYLPKVNVLNNADSHKTGYAAWEAGFRGTYKNELNEYNNKFKDYYEQTKAELGITTRDDYYSQVIAPENGNLNFKQTFESKVAGDPRMLQLMKTLGIQQPGA